MPVGGDDRQPNPADKVTLEMSSDIVARRGVLARLVFGRRGALLTAQEDHLLISGDDQMERIAVSEIMGFMRVRSGFLWARGEIPVAGRTVVLRGFSNSALSPIVERLNAAVKQAAEGWIEAKFANLRCIAAEIENLLRCDNYIRHSQHLRMLDLAKTEVGIQQNALWLAFASPLQLEIASYIVHFVRDSETLVKQANATFVDSELTTYVKFFNTIEKKPLTEAQRRACVICDDRNLVLAGAGTGKTSTMIGRAGYLLTSSRVKPEEILMLAYAKKAAQEMQTRLQQLLAHWGFLATDVQPTVKTFHALGLEIIGLAEGRRPDISVMAEDETELATFIGKQVTELCKNPGYLAKVIRYCGSARYTYRNPFDFNSIKEYRQYVCSQEFRTLKGEKVKSFEEVVIANFLAEKGVRYIYEHPYCVDTFGPDYRQYKPDFFLPDYNIYIEHFALDINGRPPEHFDQKKYLDDVTWKRNLHRTHKTTLLETYSYLKRAGLLESTLTYKLKSAGVKFNPQLLEDLLAELRKSHRISEFEEMLGAFLTLFKQSDHNVDELRCSAANNKDEEQLLLLLDLFTPVLELYEAELARQQEIDFGDMIRRAISHVESGLYQSPFTHILVDEFQDISQARANLIAALLAQRPDSVLFAVGDDWQSIYRFTGSDISYTRDFSNAFGTAAISALDTTFRFNDKIGDVATKFVLKNSAQVKKSIASDNHVDEPAVSLVRVSSDASGLALALKGIEQRVKPKLGSKTTVLVLGRYNFVFEGWNALHEKHALSTQHPSLQIDFMTMHGAKGKEADFVIVLGMQHGKKRLSE
jgi:DNA helicase-4